MKTLIPHMEGLMHQNNKNARKMVGARFIAPMRLPHLWGKAVPRYPDLFFKQHVSRPQFIDLGPGLINRGRGRTWSLPCFMYKQIIDAPMLGYSPICRCQWIMNGTRVHHLARCPFFSYTAYQPSENATLHWAYGC
jgi:hypothetical protein